MGRVMKATDGKCYEVRAGLYFNGVGVETGVYVDKGDYQCEYCIDEVNCGHALLTCGDVPVCWLPESEVYYEKRKNRVRPVSALCRWLKKRNIMDAVTLLETTDMKQGQSFSGGCEVPYLSEVKKESILLTA